MKTLLIILAIITYNLSAMDTLRHFRSTQAEELNVFKEDNIQEYSERFVLNSEYHIKTIRLKVKNNNLSTGVIKIYGDNGMDSKPNSQTELIDEIQFKEEAIENWIEIKVNENIINQNQIFVSVLLEDNKLITTKEEYKPICISEYDTYYNQQVKINNTWYNSKGKFLIELFGSFTLEKREKTYKLIELGYGIEALKNLIIADINNDNQFDILTNHGIYINKGNNKFELTNQYTDSLRTSYTILLENSQNNLKILNFNSDSLENVSLMNYDKIRKESSQEIFTLNIDIVNIKSYRIEDDNSISILADNSTNSEEYRIEKINSIYEIAEVSEIPITTNIFDNRHGKKLYHLYNGEVVEDYNTKVNIEDENQELSLDMKVLNLDNGLEYIKNSITIEENKDYENLQFSDSSRELKYRTKNRLSLIPIKTDIDNDGNIEIIMTSLCKCRDTEVLKVRENEIIDITYATGMTGEKIGTNGLTFDINNDGRLDLIVNSFGELKLYINEVENNNKSIVIRDIQNNISSIKAEAGGKEITATSYNNNGYLVNKVNELHIASTEEVFDYLDIMTNEGVKKLRNIKNGAIYNSLDEFLKINKQDLEISDLEVQAFPNPFANNVTFKIDVNKMIEDKITLNIYDMKGKKIISKNILVNNVGTYNWNYKANNKIPAGVFMYEVINGTSIQTGNIVKK